MAYARSWNPAKTGGKPSRGASTRRGLREVEQVEEELPEVSEETWADVECAFESAGLVLNSPYLVGKEGDYQIDISLLRGDEEVEELVAELTADDDTQAAKRGAKTVATEALDLRAEFNENADTVAGLLDDSYAEAEAGNFGEALSLARRACSVERTWLSEDDDQKTPSYSYAQSLKSALDEVAPIETDEEIEEEDLEDEAA